MEDEPILPGENLFMLASRGEDADHLPFSDYLTYTILQLKPYIVTVREM